MSFSLFRESQEDQKAAIINGMESIRTAESYEEELNQYNTS